MWDNYCCVVTLIQLFAFLLLVLGFLHLTFDLIIRPVGENWRPVCGRWPSKASHRLCTRHLAFYDNGLASANNEYKESLGTCHCNKSRLTPLGLNKCKGGANLLQTLPMERTRGGPWPKASL